jgi:glycosyltransferase involved in cell wall biosynthesis
MNNTKLSIVIPCFNCELTIVNCLACISASMLPGTKVICINDGSTDNTLSILKDYVSSHDFCTVIDGCNHGPASARNIGAKYSFGEFILFVDSDVFLMPETIKNMFASMFANRADCVIAMIFPEKITNIYEEFEKIRYDKNFGTTSKFVKFAPTYAALLKRSMFLALDGFDEAFCYPASEDYDFFFRAWRSGYRTFHCGKSIAHHSHASTRRDLSRRAFLYSQEGVRFGKKHGMLAGLIFSLMIGLLLPLRSFLKFKPRIAIVGCYYDFWTMIGWLSGFSKYVIKKEDTIT